MKKKKCKSFLTKQNLSFGVNEPLAWQIFSSDIALIISSNLKQYHRNSNLNLKIHFHLFLLLSDHNGRRKNIDLLRCKK